jgi:hypothetical protein
MRLLQLFGFAVIIVSIALFLALILSFPRPEQILFDLSVGWASVPLSVWPQVQVSWAGILTALACLAGVAVGLHVFLRWLSRTRHASRPWPFRWTFALLCLVVLTFVAGTSAVGLGHQAAWLATSPEPLVSRRARWGLYQQNSDLRNLAVAMLAYHEENKCLPPAAVYSKEGRPLLSWRVLVLPYLEQEALFKEFHLDEPWDSPHNLRLLPRMPMTYGSDADLGSTRAHRTHYQVFVGKGTAFEGRQGLSLTNDFPDGTSNTVLIVDAAEAVPWTKPQDLPYASGQPLPALGHLPREVFQVVLADSVPRAINRQLNERTLRAAITRNGGEELGPDW